MHKLSRQGIAAVFVFALMTFVWIPAFAQVDFSGEWTPNGNEDNVGNPYVGDWLGIPMSEASRARSEAWAASVQTLPEWQCRPHGFAYIYRGPSQLRISKEVDPVSRQITAFHAEWLRSVDVAIYLDGRPHPSENAPHTWGGFNTAEWVGDMLKIRTTHVKEVDRPKGVVPHQLPGTNTFIKEFADKIHVPEAVIRAGAETMYPEIRKKLK